MLIQRNRVFAMELAMEDSLEGETQERLISAAPPHCPKCKGYIRFTDTVLDVRRSLIVRLYRCECGEIIWEEKPE
jgi:hypothetical protein